MDYAQHDRMRDAQKRAFGLGSIVRDHIDSLTANNTVSAYSAKELVRDVQELTAQWVINAAYKLPITDELHLMGAVVMRPVYQFKATHKWNGEEWENLP